ncbi:MAG: DNA-3-methyladenine glycosylase I [Lachnospiraceae bacterium]|jgi:DNA-3-methyladenine glycosylase I|nr:DNA-3-methyladenine glycosylase I [Lachnospiraceae bacterium]
MCETEKQPKCRCGWCNLKNPLYVEYHDREWGVAQHEDAVLFELLILESFQAGLSWECVLNKRQNFRKAFDGFVPDRVCGYDAKKIEALMADPGIIRNRRKMEAAVKNARVFREIQKEYSSFDAYIWHFTDGHVVYETGKTSSELSDRVSRDLKKRGMSFVGTTILYAYLQAIGVICSHDEDCFLYKKQGTKSADSV